MRRIVLGVVGFLAVAGVIGFVVRQPTGSGTQSRTAARPGPLARAPAAPVPGPSPAFGTQAGSSVASGQLAPLEGGAGVVGAPTTTKGVHPTHGVVPIGGAEPLQPNELVGPRVIETAQLSLVTRQHAFDQAFARVTDVAARYHGYVEDSSAEGVRSKLGRVTIRVPAGSFQAALNDLRSLGRVDEQSISGQDVTAQYVDLQARLRNWEAQEQVLLKLMSRATTVGDTLRIQNELSQVQMRIEELKGQLRVLGNETAFATIDVSMRESGTPVPRPVHRGRASTLLRAWRGARDGFLSVVASVLVGLGYLLPIAALLFLGWLGVRRLRPRIPA